MSLFEIGAALIALSALFGYVNHRYLRAPHTVGLVLIALAASLGLLLVESLAPGADVDALVLDVLRGVDFHDTLMHGMLSVLLFAGALHVDLSALRRRLRTIALMASAGTLISTFAIGTGAWLLADWAGHPIPFVWALVFGALISPTDPVAVLALFRTVPVPSSLKATLAGESLFNDGVGVVVFTLVLGVALHGGEPQLLHIGELFLVEVVGGVVLGLVAGYLCYRAVHRLDETNLDILVSLAVVMATYAAALRLGASGPIAMVVAGLFVGNDGTRYAAGASSREQLRRFWSVLDEILNSVLFLLIGLEVLIIARDGFEYWMGLLAVPVALAGRWLSVFPCTAVLRRREPAAQGAVAVLTWGGLRGGIAVALALSLPAVEARPFIVSITYVVVLFSILVQGSTVAPLIRRAVRVPSASSD